MCVVTVRSNLHFTDRAADRGDRGVRADRGGGRIERAAFSESVQDPGAFDIFEEEGMERESDASLTEIDLRFVGLEEFVRERNPRYPCTMAPFCRPRSH